MLFSIENLRLPPSVLGFTVARGLLFVEALVPDNMYVDPGFTGQLYTTVTNLSGRVLTLLYGTPIARLFFYRLSEDVHQPYQTGPAIGVPQHVESVPGVAFPTAEKAKAGGVSDLYKDLVATERGGARTAELLRRNHRFARLAFLTACVLARRSGHWRPVAAGNEWVRCRRGEQCGRHPFGLCCREGMAANHGGWMSDESVFSTLRRQEFRQYFQPSRVVVGVLPASPRSLE